METDVQNYDIIVIGGGPGGYFAALKAAGLGGKVALVESRDLGGTCLNRGCIPTKTFIHLAGEKKCAAAPGMAAGAYKEYSEKAQGVIQKLRGSLAGLIQSQGIRVVSGRGSLEGEGRVRVVAPDGSEQILQGRSVVLATGSIARSLPFLPLDEDTCLSSDGVLAMKELPAAMLVVGGGAIGVEWAYVLHAIGVRVTLLEKESQLLPGEDAMVAKTLELALKKQGIEIHVGAQLESAHKTAQGWQVRANGQERMYPKVLVAVGRRTALENLGLEKLGVIQKNGFVQVNENMRTHLSWLYAVGDMTGMPMLAHAAFAQGRCAASTAMGKPAAFDANVVPRCVYTVPEIASVGITEDQARARGMEVKSGRFPYAALGKAYCVGQTEGFFKVVAEERTGRVLGVQIIGMGATDLIAEAGLLIRMKGTLTDWIETIHPHPTLSEGLWEAACVADGQGMHAASRKKYSHS